MKTERVKEREYLRYVVATLDEDGKALYLHSLHGGRYVLVDEIGWATKLEGEETASMFYDFAVHDLPNRELVLLPVMITYELIKEKEVEE